MKALITGASSGIGREIAVRLASDGYDLIVVARREDRLSDLQKIIPSSVEAIAVDLSKREDCFSLYQQVKDEEIGILVNCAGFGVFGPFDQTDLGRELSMLDVNIDAVHILTKLFLKDFMRKDYGYILNVASSAAFLPGPLFSSYYASKAYVLRLTEALRTELRHAHKNVYIGALCPGPVNTEFNQTADVKFSIGGLSASYVANYAVKKMYAKKAVIVPGALMKVVRFFTKILPDGVLARLAWYMQKKKTN